MKIGLFDILSKVFGISTSMGLRKYKRIMSLVNDFLQSGNVDSSKVAGLSGLIHNLMGIQGNEQDGFYFIHPNGRTSRLYPTKEAAEKAFAYSARQSEDARARLKKVSYRDLYNIVIKSDEIDRSKYDDEDDSKGSAFLYIYGDPDNKFGGGFLSSGVGYVEYPERTVSVLIKEAKKSDGARELLDDIVDHWRLNNEHQDVIDYIDRQLSEKEST